MKRQMYRRSRWTVFLAATLAGGTLFGTCDIRMRTALVDGTKLFLISLLNPSNFIVDLGTE